MGAVLVSILTVAGMIFIVGGTVFVCSILPIISGTIMLHATSRRKLALGLRLFGLLAFIPSLALGIFIVSRIVSTISR